MDQTGRREMRLLVRLWLAGAALLWSLALWRAESLPPPSQLVPTLAGEPRQGATGREPFLVTVGGMTYRVEPQFAYEIRGLVVSEHGSASWWRRSTFHRRAGDVLNVKDLCLVWGETATGGLYRAMRFWSGEFTCYARPVNPAGTAFDPTELSNNHLLAVDERLRKRLTEVRRGDQIRLKGLLAAYGHDNHGRPYRRGTSTRRDDTGNGACETLYVTEADILRRGNEAWRWLARLAPVGLLAGVIVWLRLPLPRR